MLTRALRNASAAALAVAAIACATTGAQPGPHTVAAAQTPLPGKPACFWLRNVYDWTVLSDSELIVHAPLTQNGYLVKLFEPVFDLDFHQGLGFEDVERTGLICGPNNDYLLVPHYQPRRIPIVAVQQLSNAEQAQLLLAAHKRVPRVLLAQQGGAATPPSAGPPPIGAPPAAAPMSAELYAYPKNGQSPEQQATDKSQCRAWASGQVAAAAAPAASGATGPTPAAPVAAGQGQNYQRAERACLEARGYSVQ